ncbi:importin-13 [Tribolium castaneum]|uniref:Importin-13 n=1 Tax=Tribolium castaneum TaxID=7070 RepID=D6WZG3_TRICA|nr:PREDICTED: importin-13 [Tribolium castaneum]EFA09709.1 Importin-13-like Protein [Tribolium castaneum]|eukprot:XP_008198199.1 PREDICTED: importin-13 [Tribolium castaneum]
MEYTAENLEKAVTLFYRTEAGQQAEAHQWLTEAQNSPQAWSFVWELLSPHRNSEVQFFAATTLHTKLMKHWNEVPEDHYELLKKRILEAIINYAMGPKIVLNRLCITLSAYIIHTVPTHWPNAFEELVSSFQPQHLPNVEPERVIWILLEILTVIPEEFQSTLLAVSQRMRVRTVLQDVSKDILKVVEMCLMPLPSAGFDMLNLTTYLNAARCASAWIQLGGLNIDDCTSVMNLLINLTCFAYWNKTDPECMSPEEMELMEVTVEALTTIIQHPHTNRYHNHVMKCSADMLYKFEKILECERNSPESNKDIVANLYGLLVTIADVHSKIFINNLKSENVDEQRISFDFFNSILKCTNLPGLYPVDESSSTLTFGFWYTLQDDILSLETAECAQLLLMIKPYYRDLVCIMLRKSMFPLNEDGDWSLDDKEVFRCYRQDIADTFIYCYNVLNLEMLDILNSKLIEALHKNNTSVVPPPIQWNEVETCLHAFGAIAESIELENLYLPKLMVTIKEIPFTDLHKKVMASALETVGSYSDWITEHPEMLENVLPLVISALDKPEVATSATMALKDLTHSCQKYLLPYADHILLAAQSALQGGALKLAECSRLMYSIGKVLSILPVPRIMDYLNIILAPSFKEMQDLLNVEPSPAVKTSLITRLKVLSSLFNSLCVKKSQTHIIEQPTVLVMQNTMPLYKVIGEKYCTSGDVMEELSILLKYVVTTLLEDCTPLINDILQLVVTVYRECPQSNILMVAKTVVIMFGHEEEFRAITQQLLHEIVSTTLQMCAQLNSANQLAEKTDVLEGFFAMMAQLIKKLPQVVFASGIDTAALFQCAVLCLSLPETQTLKLCTSFLVNFISQSRDTAQANIVQNYGESLVLRILINLGNTAPRSSVEIFSDLLLALNKKYCDNLSRWLNALLAQEDFPSPRISRQQKENFIKLVLREKANKRKLSDSVLEFTLICRGILREDPNMP